MPLPYRVPFQSTCGVFWTLYLSIANSKYVRSHTLVYPSSYARPSGRPRSRTIEMQWNALCIEFGITPHSGHQRKQQTLTHQTPKSLISLLTIIVPPILMAMFQRSPQIVAIANKNDEIYTQRDFRHPHHCSYHSKLYIDRSLHSLQIYTHNNLCVDLRGR